MRRRFAAVLVYGHLVTKFSGMGRFTYSWCSAGVLRAPELRWKLSENSVEDFLVVLALSI